MNGQLLKHDLYPVCLGVTSDQTISYREHLSCSTAKLKSRNNLIAKLVGTSWGASASTLRTSALALCYSVTEYCCPVWARSSYTNLANTQLIVQCAWFQAACNPHSSHGCQCSAILHLLLYVVKWQLIQINLCMLISLSIHLHGLHLDAQYDQTWHLSTQLCSGQWTSFSGQLLLPTLLSDRQISISLVIHSLW